MNMKRLSRQTCRFLQPPGVISCAAVAGRLEGAGPLGSCFDAVAEDSFCGRKTWEQGEAQMQADALRLALQKGGLTAEDVDCVFAGDLLNQNIGATFALRDFHIPFYGVYGACSTMGETLALAATAIAGGSAAIAAAHFVYAQLFRARLGVGAGGIQADHDPAGSGSPQLEGGFLRRWICAEVAAVVIGQLTGLMPVHG